MNSRFPYGCKAHVAECAQKWLVAREIEKLFTGQNNLEKLEIVAESLDKVEKEFWEVVKFALEHC